MALDQEKIIKNAKKYFSTGEQYGFMNESLTEFLGQEFIQAPATNGTGGYNAFEGGLIDIILKITRYAVSLSEILPEKLRPSKESIIKVCCLHQIGKAKLFIANTDKWKIDKGYIYDFNKDLIAMSIGERSVYYALSHGIVLSETEIQAMYNYSKEDCDKQAKWFSTPLSNILKQANDLAIMEELNK